MSCATFHKASAIRMRTSLSELLLSSFPFSRCCATHLGKRPSASGRLHHPAARLLPRAQLLIAATSAGRHGAQRCFLCVLRLARWIARVTRLYGGCARRSDGHGCEEVSVSSAKWQGEPRRAKQKSRLRSEGREKDDKMAVSRLACLCFAFAPTSRIEAQASTCLRPASTHQHMDALFALGGI